MFFRRVMQGALVLMILGSLLLAGCGKVTQENYEKLTVGMGFEQVVNILGDADECASKLGTKSCVWGNDAKNIKIKFVADKAIFFSKKGL